jgi:hypothetical protein
MKPQHIAVVLGGFDDVVDQAGRDALELFLYLQSSSAMAVANLREFRKLAE